MRLVRITETRHRYQACQDEYCDLPYCRIYKDGYAEGSAAGYGAGHAAGRAEGYAEGYGDGQADAGE